MPREATPSQATPRQATPRQATNNQDEEAALLQRERVENRAQLITSFFQNVGIIFGKDSNLHVPFLFPHFLCVFCNFKL